MEFLLIKKQNKLKDSDIYKPTKEEFIRDLSLGAIIIWLSFHIWNWWMAW